MTRSRLWSWMLSAAWAALLLPPAPALAVRIQTFQYEFSCAGQTKPVTLHIEEDGPQTVVSYLNEFGDHEISTFDAGLRLRQAVYVDIRGRETARVLYDYDRRQIRVTGQTQAQYPLRDGTYDNNGSLFYLFARRYPTAEAPELVFALVQTNLSHINDPVLRFLIAQLVGPVEMSLQRIAGETLEVRGRSAATVRYELGIHDGRLAGFWPNRYVFWYTQEDRTLVRYQGINAERQLAVVRLLDVQEREYPNPALPAL